MTTDVASASVLVVLAVLCACSKGYAMEASKVLAALTPQPQQLSLGEGSLGVQGAPLTVSLPEGPEHEACRTLVAGALEAAGVVRSAGRTADGNSFVIGSGSELPPLPHRGPAPDEAYVLAVGPEGIAARGASAAGLLYAAQTLRQLLRQVAPAGRLPCLQIADWPEFRLRGVYIEGGQERFGRIVDPDYLREQIRRLAEFKMNALIIECYNLFPYPSFPACADAGTLSPDACHEIVAESKRYHVTLIPSLQTLGQAWELVWQSEAGAPYREVTAPGLICPSTPEVYPLIKGLYRDLLTLFDASPLMGVGCSEIEMQWQERYCPRCQARIDAGETVRDLLLGHAEKCIAAVQELAAELGRPIRPMVWADEFYMYGPGRDWVGLERIPPDTVMGFWKYWPDYHGIEGLMARGYDVLGVSAMYNHTFYLADLSPEDPPKSWAPMEQTGTVNIAGMVQAAEAARRAHPGREFLGTVAASFSKHRLRAFDSIWYGFALNGHCTWSRPIRRLEDYQGDFTRAFTRHYYDARSDDAAEALASAYLQLDRCKSLLERANQTLHDVVGVYDTQEAGYLDNTLAGALRAGAQLVGPDGRLDARLGEIRDRARRVEVQAQEVGALVERQRAQVGAVRELGDLWLAAEKIRAHAERQILLIDTLATLAGSAVTGQASAHGQTGELAERWSAHRQRTERILERVSHLYQQGDPCGFVSLVRDMRALEAHLTQPAPVGPGAEAEVLISEDFAALDRGRWIVLGEPKVVDGWLETRAPGGWERYCGIATRDVYRLEEDRPLIVQFDVVPLEMGVDSQLFAASTRAGELDYRFCFYGPRSRFGVYTRCTEAPGGSWQDGGAGWRLRALSPPVSPGSTYRVQAQITSRSFRLTVRESGQRAWEPPLWETLAVPMDELGETGLLFADVEPPGATAATRWGRIRMWRGQPLRR